MKFLCRKNGNYEILYYSIRLLYKIFTILFQIFDFIPRMLYMNVIFIYF